VGRTARAGKVGDALTFASPSEQPLVRAIERAVGRGLERRKVDGFDYDARSGERFEIPVGERIAAHRERRAQERARSRPRAQGRPAAAGRRASNRRPRQGR
jgi:ATP-dependent RNA helicase RhlE